MAGGTVDLPDGFVLDQPSAVPQAAPAPQAATVQRAVVPEGVTRITVTPQGSDRGVADAAARGAAQGLTANFGDEIRGLVEAGGANPDDPASVYKLISGALKYWSGDQTAKQQYDAAVARERELNQQAEKQHPVASITGQIGGAVALPVGAMGQAATLPGRMAAGAGIGATLGATAGAGAGTDATSRLTQGGIGAGTGAMLGGAAPAAIEGIVRGGRALAEPVVNTIRGIRSPQDEAARRVSFAIARDVQNDPQAVSRLTPQEFGANVQGGGPATIMDMGGETTNALARSAANTSPEGRDILSRTINDRFAGQSARVTDWLRNTFNFPNADAQSTALEQVSRNVNRPNYARAMADGSRGVWDSELQRLAGAPAIQEAARGAAPGLANRGITEGFQAPRRNPIVVDPRTGRASLRRTQGGNEILPDLRFWDQVKRNLDSRIGTAQRAGDLPKVGELTGLRNSLVEHLDRLVPSYQQARAGAAHFFGAQDALEAGQNFVSRNMTSTDARRALAQMSPTERQLFQDGFVSRFVDTINQIGDRRTVLNKIAESPAAREKLQIALGRDRANELEAMLRIEGIMDLKRGAVQGNSTTVRQLAELGLAGGAGLLGQGGDISNLHPSALMTAALVYGAARGHGRINANVSREVANLLASNDPRLLLRGIRIVARNNTLFNSLRRVDQGLVRISGQQAPAIPVLQAAGVGRADDKPNVPRPPGK